MPRLRLLVSGLSITFQLYFGLILECLQLVKENIKVKSIREDKEQIKVTCYTPYSHIREPFKPSIDKPHNASSLCCFVQEIHVVLKVLL